MVPGARKPASIPVCSKSSSATVTLVDGTSESPPAIVGRNPSDVLKVTV